MIYCDTSLLIAALTPEASSDTVLAWQSSSTRGSLCISPWCLAEVASALSIKVRSGHLSSEQRDRVNAPGEQCITKPLR
jgi:predicted nucleic acid-binding protein